MEKMKPRRTISGASKSSSIATIKDVARIAGVSTATVSNVLNHVDGKVSEETRHRIQQVIRRIRYHPNLLARGLQKRKTGLIGVMIIDPLNPFFMELVKGIHDICRQWEYNMLLCFSDDNLESETEHLHDFLERRVDGIFLTPVLHRMRQAGDVEKRHRECVEEILSQHIPLCSLLDSMTGAETCVVHVDHANGAQKAMDHLFSLGHTRIAYLSAPFDPETGCTRRMAYIQGYRDRGLPVNDDWILEAPIGREPAYYAMKEFLSHHPCITAVFCFNDLMAIGALHAIRQAQISVPDDISIIGYDNIEESRFQGPPLTTVHLKMYDIGEHAVRLVHDQIQKKKAQNDIHVRIIPSLVIRESTAPPRG